MTPGKFDNESVFFIGTATERREAAERRRLQQLAERSRSIAAQSAPEHDPRRRIELWEHLHAMYLPRSANHRLVNVIAQQTALSVEQVRAEQQRRAAATVPAGVELTS